MCNACQNYHTTRTNCTLLQHFISKTLQCYYFLTDYSHFMVIRSRYSNRAVTYSYTTVRKCRFTLIKQSALEHNLDFESIILSIIPYLFHYPYKSLNSSSEIYPYFTDSSEKVVIVISLARIYVNNVAPISVDACLVHSDKLRT